ncbi:MAG: hypothetical protein ACTJFK_00825 [Psychrobacter sp.]
MRANKEDAVNLGSWGFYLLVVAVLALIGWGFFQITLNAEIHVDNTNASYRNYEKLADMIAGADRLPNNDSRSNFTSIVSAAVSDDKVTNLEYRRIRGAYKKAQKSASILDIKHAIQQ